MPREPATSRAGIYRRQPPGYSAFIPAPLPPQPSVDIDQELQTLLSDADRALGRLDGSIQTLPDPDPFVLMYVRKEAVLSSQIEGTQSSLNDLLKVEAKIFDPETPRDVGEVLNYVNAMNTGLARLNELPISVRLIREIHAGLMRGVRGDHAQPGEIRTSQNWIGIGGSILANATFVPPPPYEVMPALGELETFIHNPSPVPLLIKIGLVHAQFETIHPFLDGNGRIGRLLITFLLCQNAILQKPVLYISHYLKQHRSEYYERLQNVRDRGEWEDWLKFFLRGIAEVSSEATDTARRVVNMRENDRRAVTTTFGRTAANGLTILEMLYRRPLVTVNEIAASLHVTYATANQIATRFIDAGILFEITGQQRNRVFRYTPYVDLFSENPALAP